MIKSSLYRFTLQDNLISFLMNLKAPSISRKVKDATKVALAFSIAYLIALKVGWLSPFWAAFTVGQISFYPGGQSIHNGFMRVAGLFPAILVATFIFAVAAQDRWLFVGLAVLWMMLATYMMFKDQAHWYLWNVAGFAAFIFLSTTFSTSTELFNQMISRLLDCSLGIIIYTLVMVFIWPDSNIGTIKKTTVNLISTQSKIFTLMASQNNSEDKNSLRQAVKQELLLQNGLKQAFFAKGSETYQVQETAEFWKEFHGLSVQLSQTFIRLNNSIHGLKNIDIYRLMPELDKYREVIIQRFTLAGDILENGDQEFKTDPIVLSVDETYLAGLSPFDQLAYASSRKEFEKVEELSGKIVRCANNIMDESVHKKEIEKKAPVSIYERLIPDLDILQQVIFIGSFVFAMFCIWFFYDPPGHKLWIYLPPTVAMSIAFMPQFKTNAWLVPGFFILSFFMLVYVVIFPKLSGAVELSIALFIVMFGVKYFLKGGIQFLAFLGVGTKIMLHNEQTYNFVSANSMTILHLSSYALVFVFSYIMGTPRPQRAVLWRIRRYYRSALFLTSVTALGQQMNQQSIWMKFKIAFHRYELQRLPLKIKPWAAVIDHKYFSKNSPDAVEDMLISLNGLSESLDEWFKSNSLPQTPLMFDETKKELEAWRSGIVKVFQSYTHNLDSALSHNMQEGLNRHIKNLEEIVNRHAKEVEQVKEVLSEEEKENLFRLIASYQVLSHALISYASTTEKIDWEQWKEEMF